MSHDQRFTRNKGGFTLDTPCVKHTCASVMILLLFQLFVEAYALSFVAFNIADLRDNDLIMVHCTLTK